MAAAGARRELRRRGQLRPVPLEFDGDRLRSPRLPGHASASGFVFFASLPLALALAALSHRYFEAPFLRLRERFRAPAKAR